MKRITVSIILFFSLTISIMAQGWPANYGGVMLQGFYWDSYSETSWANLTSQADELSKYFDIIWVPNSGNCLSTTSMGYSPIYWYDETSSFGDAAALNAMISTFKAKGTGIIEDVVINHRNGVTRWTDFPTETNPYDNTSYSMGLSDICANDEYNSSSSAADERTQYGSATGANDTGDNFDGCRDLDHTSANVQTNVKAYLKYLLNTLGYVGFRYDMVKGYSSSYTGIYNAYSNPTYSVGEYWDSSYDNVVGWINGTKVNDVIQSAAFDFPLKYSINSVFNNSTWSGLSNKGIAGASAMSRYAVTFVDNHDTYRNTSDKVSSNVLAANAFILAMPGTPCIFWPHWTAYKTELENMIIARKAAGVTNQSNITTQKEYGGGYVTEVTGSKARLLVLSGYVTGYNVDRYKAVSIGTADNPNYAFYISEDDPMSYHPDHLAAYFEVPSSYGQIYCYTWNGNTLISGDWPGTACLYVGTASNGNNIWRWETAGTTTTPANIIFTNKSSGSYQTADLTFTNGGYYVYDGTGSLSKTMNPTMSSAGYDRQFTESRHSTVCLPFAMTESEVSSLDGKLYKMGSYDSGTGTIHFTRVTSTEAYKPYMFIANSTAKSFDPYKWVAITTGSVSEDVSEGMHFTGTMERKQLVSNTTNTYFGYKESDGTFVKAGTTNGVYVNPYRCYFYTTANSGAKLDKIVFDDSTTGISTISTDNPDLSGNVYSMDGRIVRSAGCKSQLSKGIYIINGKKIVIR